LDAVLFESKGEFSVDEYLEEMERFLASEIFRPGMASLWDFRETTVDSVSPEDLKEIARYNSSIASRRGDAWKVALVVGEPLAFGLSRMFGTFAHDAPNLVNVFRTMEEADKWLSSETTDRWG
jgi:hypothetical protein